MTVAESQTYLNVVNSHIGSTADYKTWDGSNWTVQIYSDGQFKHTKEGDKSSHDDKIIKYISWDNKKWTAEIVDLKKKQFRHTPKDAEGGRRTHTSTILTYLTWDGIQWTMALK